MDPIKNISVQLEFTNDRTLELFVRRPADPGLDIDELLILANYTRSVK